MGKVELNIGVDPELIEQAQRLGLPINGLDERALRLRLQQMDPAGAEARAQRWADDNAEAIKAYNERIARDGCFGEEFRNW